MPNSYKIRTDFEPNHFHKSIVSSGLPPRSVHLEKFIDVQVSDYSGCSLCATRVTHTRAHTHKERDTPPFYLPLQVCIGVSSATVDRPAAT